MKMSEIQKGDRLEYSHPPYGKILYGTVISVHKTHFVFKFDNMIQSKQYVTLDYFNKIN
jgi:hypothetical protein